MLTSDACKPGQLPPEDRTMLPPETGWQAETLYLVDVAFSRHNPIHRAYLRVGFLNGRPQSDGQPSPGGYTRLWSGSYYRPYELAEAHYLKVVRELYREEGPIERP